MKLFRSLRNKKDEFGQKTQKTIWRRYNESSYHKRLLFFCFYDKKNFRYCLLAHIKGAPLPEVKILTLRVSSAAAAF